jgi:hypothetical protein
VNCNNAVALSTFPRPVTMSATRYVPATNWSHVNHLTKKAVQKMSRHATVCSPIVIWTSANRSKAQHAIACTQR